MRKTGKRTLAGIAAGALALALVPFVGATNAQAAPTTTVYCSNADGGGSAGTGSDPTTVKPNCTLPAGPTTVATFSTSALNGGDDSVYVFTVTGTGIFVETTTNPKITVSSDGKTAVYNNGAAVAASAAFTDLGLTVPVPGVNTVSISAGPTGELQDLTDMGTLTVTGTGTASQALVSQGYYAVDVTSTATAPVAIVHVLDAQGNVLDLSTATVSDVVTNDDGGAIAVGNATLYVADDCDADGELDVNDPGDTATAQIVTDACATTLGAGVRSVANSGMWVEWTGNTDDAVGSYTVTFNLTLGAETYPISVSYVISSTLVGAWDLSLDSDSYQLGALAQATISATDLGGRIIPDGIWNVTRDIDASTNAPIYLPTTGANVDPGDLFLPVNTLATYNGSTVYGVFFVPPTPMAAFAFTVETSGTAGWSAVAQNTEATVTATIGDPAPVEASVMITGDRLNNRRVIVEGNTENLAGSTVTPFFRFPGQVGFTQGVGTRTVAADETFAWQRKTGKKIAVQFRFGDVRSNTVIIQGR